MANVTPVALWQFNETSGTNANDSIGNNDGILKNNPTWTAGQVNGALSFDGVNDYVQVADNNALDFGTGDFSISTWVKTTDSSGIDVLLDKRVEASGPVQGYVLYNYNGKLGFQLADGIGRGWSNYVSNVSITDGNWHQVTVTIDRDSTTGGKWYVDGVQVGTFNPTGRQGSLSNSKPLTIGRRSDSSWAGYFKGSLDEVQLFNKSLSASEVSSLYDDCKTDKFLTGTSRNDTLVGCDGNDTLQGLAGNDRLYGKSGNDYLSGSYGQDYLYGDSGNDRLYGGSENDRLYAGSGNDYLYGNSGQDYLYGNSGNDRLYGGSENDRLYAGSGNDYLYGNSGNDYLRGDQGNDYLVGGAGNDTLTGVYTYSNPGRGEVDTLTGGTGADRFIVGDASNVYYKGNGIGDYALIRGFNASEGDSLQLKGPKSSYYLVSGSSTSVNGKWLGAGIFQNGDVVAIFESTGIGNVSQIFNNNTTFVGSNSIIKPTIDATIPSGEVALI